MNLKSELISIDPSKPCLKFLANRILNDNYRGIHISQHNRYDSEILISVLEIMYEMVGMEKMYIRTTDLSKRPKNTPEEYVYAKYIDKVNKINGKYTQDSLRKNLFVDLHRMRLINRYDSNGNIVGPNDKGKKQYVSLSNDGLEMIQCKNDPFKKNIIYTKAIDNLTDNLAMTLLDVTLANDKQQLDIYEFMFFISFNGYKINNKTYKLDELTEYMLQYRRLSYSQREEVKRTIEKYCNPNSFNGNKTAKRDYPNWKNESQQIFMLMKDTLFFEEKNEVLKVRVGENGIYESNSKLKRSILEKNNYFKYHQIEKRSGFELHHIIPLLLAKTRNDFDVLDTWKNMLYIDGYTHSKISQTNNKNIVLSFNENDVCLSDIAKDLDDIECKFNENVAYNTNNQNVMLAYNDSVLSNM